MNIILLRPDGELEFPERWLPMERTGRRAEIWHVPELAHRTLRNALLRASRGADPLASEPGVAVRNGRIGALVTAGPFPVRRVFDGESSGADWFFPRPLDVSEPGTVRVGERLADWDGTACGLGMRSRPPQPWVTESGRAGYWWSGRAYAEYLRDAVPGRDAPVGAEEGLGPEDFYRTADLSVTVSTHHSPRGERLHRVQLHHEFQMGIVAEAKGAGFHHPIYGGNRIAALLDGEPLPMTMGSGDRECRVDVRYDAHARLPVGLNQLGQFHPLGYGRYAVKWVLLSPAIWPKFLPGLSAHGTLREPHPGGWLPNWVAPETGDVLLRTVDEAERSRRRLLNEAGQGYGSGDNSLPIAARLVAGRVASPLLVPRRPTPEEDEAGEPPAPFRHAVVAGAVYYFVADSEADAVALASALNWHGAEPGTRKRVRNRRSTLLGEKGYGIGVCGTWRYRVPGPGMEP